MLLLLVLFYGSLKVVSMVVFVVVLIGGLVWLGLIVGRVKLFVGGIWVSMSLMLLVCYFYLFICYRLEMFGSVMIVLGVIFVVSL